MKFATTLLLGLLVAATAAAQGTRTEERTFPVTNANQVLSLNLPFGQMIEVKGWDKEEVTFTAEVSINGGALNDAFEVAYETSPSKISIEMSFDREMMEGYEGTWTKEECEELGGSGGYWNWDGDSPGTFICQVIRYTVYVPRNMEVHLETINSTVELRELEGPLKIKSINGPVDLTWNPRQKASFRFRSIHGELFSNLDMEVSENTRSFGLSLDSQWKGGGPKVQVETINSHIYVRKP